MFKKKKKHKSWCVDSSKKLQEQNESKEGKKNLVKPGITKTVLCSGISEGH